MPRINFEQWYDEMRDMLDKPFKVKHNLMLENVKRVGGSVLEDVWSNYSSNTHIHIQDIRFIVSVGEAQMRYALNSVDHTEEKSI